MVGMLFQDSKLFNSINLTNSFINLNRQYDVQSCKDYDKEFFYSISDGDPLVDTIVTQKLIDSNCNLVIYIYHSTDENGIVNIRSFKDSKVNKDRSIFKFTETKLVSLNNENVTIVNDYLLSKSKSIQGISLACNMHNVQLLLLGVTPDKELELSKILKSKLALIINTEYEYYFDSNTSEYEDITAGLFSAFEKVVDNFTDNVVELKTKFKNTPGGGYSTYDS